MDISIWAQSCPESSWTQTIQLYRRPAKSSDLAVLRRSDFGAFGNNTKRYKDIAVLITLIFWREPLDGWPRYFYTLWGTPGVDIETKKTFFEISGVRWFIPPPTSMLYITVFLLCLQCRNDSTDSNIKELVKSLLFLRTKLIIHITYGTERHIYCT